MNRGRTIVLLCALLIISTPVFMPGIFAGQPCADNLNICPDIGCAKQGSPNALSNQLKRNLIPVDLDSSAGRNKIKKVTFVTMKKLQKLADNLVGQDHFLTEDERELLKNLKVGKKSFSEGDAVRLSGYIVGKTHANRGESVNCNLTGESNNDFHITLADIPEYDASAGPEEGIDRTDLEFKGIVVEMVPQERPVGWTIKKLRKIQREGKQVIVVGQLFFDSKHRVNDDPEHPLKSQPKRISLWEIHPVRKFFTCEKSNGSCDEDNYEDWTELK